MGDQTPFDLEPLPATFGATVIGLRLTGLSDEAFAALYRTRLDFGLLIFPGQHLSRTAQVAFARWFATLVIGTHFSAATAGHVARDGQVYRLAV
jgi:alpha-ketoglutarate-dependent taurine dioxygenase